jgi:hypothetical protein
MILHAIDRGIIHFFSSMGALTSAFFAFRVLVRRKPTWPLPQAIPVQLLLCAVIVVLAAFLREPFDVAQGDPSWKSYSDLASWILGCACGFWGIKRLIVLDWK